MNSVHCLAVIPALLAQQAIDVHFASGPNVHMSIGDGWHREFYRRAGFIAAACLLAVVQLIGQVSGVIGMQDRGATGMDVRTFNLP